MEIDESDENSKNAEALQRLISKGPLPSALSRLSGSSRGIPFEKDFHFYNNFSEFKSPIKLSDENSSLTLKKIGSAKKLWGTGKGTTFPEDSNDLELEPYDWLVNLNDDVLETFDVSIDEFKETRKKEEESGVRIMKMGMDDDTDGFQMVHGKNKNKREAASSGGSGGVEVGGNVQVATKVEAKVHFHIASVPRPQDVYKIIMNNSNQPFEHVWFEKTEDGSKSIHPLEKFSPLDFVDKNVENIEPIKPPPLESTPFMFVEEVKDLKILATKLRNADEFAVDLEHNQYRSFQGLTCLMQISTRTEDFVVDTLKLRIHIGPYLRDVFKDPTKKKVLHGSDRDIVWLQRDFGIYICNMFDTGQASRILKLERNSLEHLLQHFCEVKANKEYQNAEWRRRPLPQEMIKYAREDTHYLLYIYDVMRLRLNELTPETEESDPPLIEVYKRSYDLCMQLYEKELFTDDSYLRMFGLRDADLKAEQLAVVAGLYEWRDVVARAEDESTGYILPNKILIEIGKQMPLTANKLKYLLKSMHSYCSHIERNLGSVVSIIRHSMQNAAHFEPAVQHLKELKEQRLLKASEENAALNEASEVLPSENSETITEDTSVKVASVEVVKKKSSAFGALLGNSAKRKFQSDNSNKEAEQMKLEKIISEVNLPFHAFVEKEEVEEESLPVKNDEEQVKNDEFPFTFNNSNGPESELKMEGGDENISLTELSSSFNQCFKSINETRKGNNSSGKSTRENEVLPELEPFDYEAAREQIKFGKAPCGGGGGGDGEVGKGKRGKGQKKGGVSLTMKEEDELLPQGKRRQAFPASGNRSATFRQS